MKEYSETFSADGDSAIYAVNQGGHKGTEPVGFVVAGTWGGGTMTAQVSFDKASPVYGAVPDASWAANVGDKLEVPQGAYIKFVLASSTTPTLTLDLKGNITKR